MFLNDHTLIRLMKNLLPALVLALFLFSGCTPPKTEEVEEVTETVTSSEDACNDWLDSSFDMLQPDRLVISAEIEAPVSLLNQWAQSCIDPDLIEKPLTEEELKNLLTGEILERTLDSRFDSMDALHIRDNLLYKMLVEKIISNTSDEIGQIVAIFNHVTRNITLQEKNEPAFDMTAFDVMKFGRGKVTDRIWVFCNLLRQMKIDSVLLSIPGEKEDSEKNYLVGVILNSGIYLFDPLTGTPLPGKDDDPGKNAFVTRPATYSEIMNDPKLLDVMKSGKDDSYPFTIEVLKKPVAQVVGDSSYYSDRMRALQYSSGGEQSVILSDSLIDNDSGDGLLTRVGEAGKDYWSKAELTNWSDYEKQNLGSYKLTPGQKQILSIMSQPFQLPLDFKFAKEKDENGMMVVERTDFTKRQLKSRIQQMVGNLGDAIKMYQDIQLQITNEFMPLSQQLKMDQKIILLNVQTVQDAMVWRGVCSYETGDFETAVERFYQYMQITKGQGKWSIYCRLMTAHILAQLGNRESALKLLSNPSENSVYYREAKFYNNRWFDESMVKPKEEPAAEKSKDEEEKGKDKEVKKEDNPEEKKESETSEEKPDQKEEGATSKEKKEMKAPEKTESKTENKDSGKKEAPEEKSKAEEKPKTESPEKPSEEEKADDKSEPEPVKAEKPKTDTKPEAETEEKPDDSSKEK